MKDIRSQQAFGLVSQERLPRRVDAYRRWRPTPGDGENPVDRANPDSVTQAEKLSLDPRVAPTAVLGGKAQDQRVDLLGHRRPPWTVRVGPLARDESSVQAQHRRRRDQTVAGR